METKRKTSLASSASSFESEQRTHHFEDDEIQRDDRSSIGAHGPEGANSPTHSHGAVAHRSQEQPGPMTLGLQDIGRASPLGERPDLDTHSHAGSRPGTKRRRGRVRIAKPKALTGSSFITVCLSFLHYMIICFLFMGGRYFNDAPPPLMLFIIPSFIAAAGTIVGILCLVMQGTWIVRKLCEPSTGLKISILGIFGCAVWSLVIYGPLRQDYTQAIQLFQTGGVVAIYYLLIRRRLRFASIAFTQGAKAVSRLKALWFRISLHGLLMLVYVTAWSIVYLQLIRMPDTSDTAAAATTSPLSTTTPVPITTTPEPSLNVLGINLDTSKVPLWIRQQISDGTVRTAARVFLVYDLLVFSHAVKGSVWLSASACAAAISVAARKGGPVRLRSGAQLNTKLRESLPSLAVSGHVQLAAAVIRCMCEALRKCTAKRSGVLHNTGALLHTLTKPLVSRMNVLGLCDMGTSDRNIVAASTHVWHELDALGLLSVVNDDVIFGARICSSLLFASVSSVIGRILVELLQFPTSVTLDVGTMCFIISFFIGNLGMEAGEAWAVSLLLQYARAPEALYVANAPLANALFCVVFGLDVSDKPHQAKLPSRWSPLASTPRSPQNQSPPRSQHVRSRPASRGNAEGSSTPLKHHHQQQDERAHGERSANDQEHLQPQQLGDTSAEQLQQGDNALSIQETADVWTAPPEV